MLAPYPALCLRSRHLRSEKSLFPDSSGEIRTNHIPDLAQQFHLAPEFGVWGGGGEGVGGLMSASRRRSSLYRPPRVEQVVSLFRLPGTLRRVTRSFSFFHENKIKCLCQQPLALQLQCPTRRNSVLPACLSGAPVPLCCPFSFPSVLQQGCVL